MPIGTFANGKVSTMSTGGCGPTALSAIANMYGNGMSPADMGKYASLNGYITQGGANERLFTEGAARLGMQSSKVTKGNLRDAINSGKPTIISGTNSGPFTKAGHVVVANGTDRNGNAIILDPSDGKIKSYNPSQLESGMTGAWSYAVGYGNNDIANNLLINSYTGPIKREPEINPIFMNGINSKSTTNPITIGNLPSFGFNTLGNPTVSNDINMALNPNSPLSSEAREEALRKIYDPLGIMTKDQLTTTLKNDGKADVASRLDDKYSNKKSTSDGKSSTESTTYSDSGISASSTDTATANATETPVDWIPDLKESLNKEHTTLGGLFGAFKNFGYAMKAALGVLKGEGTFSEIYNNLKNGDTLGNSELTSYEGAGSTITADSSFTPSEEKDKIWVWLHNQGYRDAAASGIMGCWENESRNRAQTIEANWISEFPGYNVIPADRDAMNNFTVNGVFKKTKGVNKPKYLASDGRYYPGIGYPQWTGPRAKKFLDWTKIRHGTCLIHNWNILIKK